MSTSLRVLILEDRHSDAELFVHALSRAGYVLEWRRVDSEAAFLAALADVPELILADYSLPQFSALEAVRLLRGRGHNVPFIVVSGTIGEESAVECLKAGADDYLLKDRLARLGHAVRRALGEHEQHECQRAAEAELAHQALHDPLTDLPNRALLRTHLQRALHGQLAGSPPLALLLLDLDRFKEVNDTLGHQVGDVLLQQIGQRLKSAIPAADVVARLGGDEFALLLPGTDAKRAAQVVEDVQRILHTPFVLEGQPIAVDVSIGLALAPEHGQDADRLLQCADIALYQAKRSGAGSATYRPDQERHRPDRLALLGELRSGIDCNELRLHYQPKLDLRDGKLVGVEALVRWQHPRHGFLPPSEFIPAAEQTGLIYPLSLWVLETALLQHQAWRAMGMDIPVAVNLSRRVLHDQRLPDMVAELLARWDIAPTALVLEITESGLMADPAHARENLTRLRGLGVRLSIDDFGTGYSSLASLKTLSVDELKIDQSFVQAMATDASSRAIVRAIIDLADALKLRVVAEGVEDRATWDLLTGLGCDVAQGYLLSPPIAVDELETWVAEIGPSWLEIAERSDVQDVLQERIRLRGARLTAEEEFIARKQAEVALRASEERNRLALQAAGMGTWDWDVIHDVRTWSTETEALCGLTAGTFEGTFAAVRRAVHPDDWPAFEIEERTAQAEHRDSMTTYRTVWPDGTVHWIESKGRWLYSADGTLVRVTGTSMDISERKRLEQRFRGLLESAPDAMVIVDNRGCVQLVNRQTEVLFGYSREELIGHPVEVLVPERFRNGHVGTRSGYQHKPRPRTMGAGLELFGLRKDGSEFPVEISLSPMESEGEVLVSSAIRDISARKQADQALRASEERFRNQYKGIPLPTYSWLQVGDDFVLQDFNDAAEAITEGHIRNWLGRRASERFANEPQLLADLQECAAEQHTLRRELRYRFPDTGRDRDLALTFVFVPTQTVMVHTQDITLAKQAEQQREAMARSEKLRALGQMASGIAHDLNQSLMLVASYSDLARQALVQDPPNLTELEDLLTTTTQAALDGGETVKRLLLFTRAAPEQNSQLVDLSDVVRDAAQLTAPRWRDAAQAAGRPIRLHIEAEGHPTTQGSAARLRELMTNLIFNAVDALPTGGTIRLRVAAKNGHGIIEVIDSGAGMSAAVQARVFEPFFTTKGEGGTGLGLAMVFGIVEQHGGHIEVRSAPGDGTTFGMTFPLVDASAEAAPSPPPPAQLQPLRLLRVLVVDDEPMMTKAVVRMLRPSGHLVSVAESGEEALEMLAEQTFDVVVSDMGMGAGMNGWELAEAVRRRWPGVRFLLATGWGAALDPGEAQAKGVEAVLAKPYHPADLLRALARTQAAA